MVQGRGKDQRTADRVRRLQQLRDGGHERHVREALERLKAQGRRFDTVDIRCSFVRRDSPWPGEVSDTRLPPRAERPPAPRLLSPNGLALRLYLTALYVAACTTRRGAPFVYSLRLRPDHGGGLGWSELIASPTSPSPASANRQATARDNKVRQLKSALDKLASDDVRLVALGQGRGKYDRFQLNDEASSQGMADDVPYTVPTRGHRTLRIPASFFFNGWHHALTGSETLAYLALHELRRLAPTGHDQEGVRLPGAVRLRSYGLSKDTYEDLQSLARFGLVDAVTDPNRREDGTFEGYSQGSQPMPNRYRLIDEATGRLGVETVLAAL